MHLALASLRGTDEGVRPHTSRGSFVDSAGRDFGGLRCVMQAAALWGGFFIGR